MKFSPSILVANSPYFWFNTQMSFYNLDQPHASFATHFLALVASSAVSGTVALTYGHIHFWHHREKQASAYSATTSSGQISIIPKPELRGFWGSSLIKPPFRVTSADVVIICLDIMSLQPQLKLHLRSPPPVPQPL